MRLLAIATAPFLVLLASCSLEKAVETKAVEPEKVFTEHQFITASAATKGWGEDCSKGGPSDCSKKAPICWHYKAEDPATGYVCTTPCRSEQDCPDLWGCVAISQPAEGNSFCAPPKTWSPQATAQRANIADTKTGGAQ